MTYEARVWSENGDLLGYAIVEPVEDGYGINYYDVDESSGYNWAPSTWSARRMAEDYAREWAKGYVEWLRETCLCEESDCGVMHEHGVFVQECEHG